jgi:hypothetical protein
MNIYTSEVEYLRNKVKQLEEALAQQEQGEPVAWYHAEDFKTHFTTGPSEDLVKSGYWQPLYKKAAL